MFYQNKNKMQHLYFTLIRTDVRTGIYWSLTIDGCSSSHATEAATVGRRRRSANRWRSTKTCSPNARGGEKLTKTHLKTKDQKMVRQADRNRIRRVSWVTLKGAVVRRILPPSKRNRTKRHRNRKHPSFWKLAAERIKQIQVGVGWFGPRVIAYPMLDTYF